MNNIDARALAVAGLCALALSGCTSSNSKSNSVDQQTASPGSSVATDTVNVAPAKKIRIVESGFGQNPKDLQYAWVTALVHNDAAAVGDFVVVNFNMKDPKGNLIASGSQTDQFSRDGEDLAVGTQVEVTSKAKVASVEATAVLSNNASKEAFPELPTGAVKVIEKYGYYKAQFEVTNPLGDPVKSPHIGVICKDGAGKVNGGGISFPDLIPPKGKVLADTSVMVSDKPSSCKAYAGGPVF